MTLYENEDEPRLKLLVNPSWVFFGSLVMGYLLRLVFGVRLPLPRAFAEGLGELIVLVAIWFAIGAFGAFSEQAESAEPGAPTRALVTAGPYKRSRNPMYLAMLLFGAGLAIATTNFWMLMTTAIAAPLLHVFAVLPEERYLEARFGADYAAYKASVRRWL
ncbi:MAG: methyltransferase family protein [Parvularculaceae bacterium]